MKNLSTYAANLLRRAQGIPAHTLKPLSLQSLLAFGLVKNLRAEALRAKGVQA